MVSLRMSIFGDLDCKSEGDLDITEAEVAPAENFCVPV